MTPQEIQTLSEWMGNVRHLALLTLVGALVGLGQLLSDGVKLTGRSVVGRCITSGGIGASSAAALTWMPDLPFAAQLGIAAALASLGTSGLTLLFQKFLASKVSV